jgi:NADPH-dependent 2,4-dienoyl-CoA reductase/sulfur reductase-like enzyme/peroxiredoxin family protein/rhodanese-related sulfurtransferase/TusA-related sulfurtransferase
MKILIIGGVAGGASTATRLRRNSEKDEIIIFEKGKDISYANCGIPYYIGDVIKDRDQLVLVNKDFFEKNLNIRIKTRSDVISINTAKKTITVLDYQNNNTYDEKYDKLVLSPGGAPIKPDIQGINDSRIFMIRNLYDMDKIKSFINENNPKKAVIVGAGFIGLEIAENLSNLGIMVTIVELADQVMNLMDYEMATFIHQHLQSKKIELFLHDGVKSINDKGRELEFILQSGRSVKAGMAILSIGIKPEIKIAKEAGITLGEKGGIKVNEFLETNFPDIYAVGDAAEVKDMVLEKYSLIPLANAANKQGRIAADNINGSKLKYNGTPGTAIAKIFDLTAAITGASEKQLKKSPLKYSKVFLNPSSHAGYYPDAYPMIFKLLYEEKSGRLLGAQIIGAEGVDKRIDVVSAMIQNGKSVFDLSELELAYAPPYSSAKDPVNIAAMIAINQLKGDNPVIFWDEVNNFINKVSIVVDVRTKLEYELDHIEGSLNIPYANLRESLDLIQKNKNILIYCNQGKTAYFALRILKNLGYKNLFNLSGGFKLYKSTLLKQENVGIFDNYFVDKADDIHRVVAKTGNIFQIDACGMQCPGPILKLSENMKSKNIGDVIELISTDQGFRNDISVWCERTGNILLDLKDENKKIIARIQKSLPKTGEGIKEIPHDKTIVVFSNDLDRAIASFIIANGALSMGRKVTMFFTFWGLNILRKNSRVKVKKTILEKIFSGMMPRGTKKLSLSKMNMMGMGAAMIKHVMKINNVDSVEKLIDHAIRSGVKIIACQMSMELMGIKKEELINGVDIGGVATYLGAAEFSDTNLFI